MSFALSHGSDEEEIGPPFSSANLSAVLSTIATATVEATPAKAEAPPAGATAEASPSGGGSPTYHVAGSLISWVNACVAINNIITALYSDTYKILKIY
jgi:hypothetical protein